jgi:diaminohydroxyphosphoribosylaminopyrimidine deaminase/5-amino-6-(5-phosphoribosylamino)uracil reductase
MVEGGPALAAAFVDADLVDEAHLFRSPLIVGADGIDALDAATEATLMRHLRQCGSEQVGADRHEVYQRG